MEKVEGNARDEKRRTRVKGENLVYQCLLYSMVPYLILNAKGIIHTIAITITVT